MSRLAAAVALLALLGVVADPARAQPVNITLSRLRFPVGSPEAMAAAPLACQGGAYCADFDGYRALMAQLGGAAAPIPLQPARTLGSRHFYVGLTARVAGLEDGARYWQLGTEGPPGSTLDGGNPSPDSLLGSYTFVFRQGLPFGLQLGAEVGRVARSNLWVWGAEGQWALLEGYRHGPLAYLPDIALRFAVRTLTGDPDLTLVLPAAELVASKPITLSSTSVLTPLFSTQIVWVLARTGSVDLSPDQPAIGSGGCEPSPPSLDPANPSSFPFGGCGAGDDAGFGDHVQFPRVVAPRVRATLGLQLRHRAWVSGVAFLMDLSRPSGLKSRVPADVPRQWSAQVSTGLTY